MVEFAKVIKDYEAQFYLQHCRMSYMQSKTVVLQGNKSVGISNSFSVLFAT